MEDLKVLLELCARCYQRGKLTKRHCRQHGIVWTGPTEERCRFSGQDNHPGLQGSVHQNIAGTSVDTVVKATDRSCFTQGWRRVTEEDKPGTMEDCSRHRFQFVNEVTESFTSVGRIEILEKVPNNRVARSSNCPLFLCFSMIQQWCPFCSNPKK